jgi:spermidine/putrescine transport system permease protein
MTARAMTARAMTARRRPSILAIVTGVYLVWSLTPLVLAVRVALSSPNAFNGLHGFTLSTIRLALRDPGSREILQRSFVLATAVAFVATPIGAALAFGLHRWRGSLPRVLTGLTVVAVVTPQAALGVAAFFTYLDLVHLPLRLPAVFLAHVTLAIPFVVLIVRARLLGLPVEAEEVALDLGASPISMVRRVLLPLSVPALIAGGAIAFTLSFDNIVLSHWLCIANGNACTLLPALLSSGRGGAIEIDPFLYAMGTIGMAITLLMMTVVLLVLATIRRQSRSSARGTLARPVR